MFFTELFKQLGRMIDEVTIRYADDWFRPFFLRDSFIRACKNNDMDIIENIHREYNIANFIDIPSYLNLCVKQAYKNNHPELGLYLLKETVNIWTRNDLLNYRNRQIIFDTCKYASIKAIRNSEFELAIELLTNPFANTRFEQMFDNPQLQLLEVALSREFIFPQFVAYVLNNYNIDIHARIENKNVLIHAIFQNAFISVIEMLIWHGANVNAVYENDTVLMHAIKLKAYETAKVLVKAGADVNATNLEKLSTPLSYACVANSDNFPLFLIDEGANLKIDISSISEEVVQGLRGNHRHENNRANNMFFSRNDRRLFKLSKNYAKILVIGAIKSSNFELFEKIIDSAGLNELSKLRNAHDELGRNILMIACTQPNQKIVEYIYENLNICSADFITDIDAARNTALMHACQHQNYAIVDYLLSKHSDNINAINNRGQTALMKLCKSMPCNEPNGVRIARLLLDHGATLNFVDTHYESALDYAKGNQTLLNLFEDYQEYNELHNFRI